ncbi:hypothetical protein FMEXI_8127 [Fusarium mexicanum]|uniref:Uncharacterized protein n=1 Tax=Fusarium mexicanum TaxID=751941 RepID=A0A8H5IQT2_9HYPO|nr:hypothetical protein FMEXI_8127 [Fusarium mexicanum]
MDCSPERLGSLVSDEEVEFDADIAGPGVLAAFLITSLIALATLILAFLTISVPARLLNSEDAVIAAGVRRAYRRLRAKLPKTKRTKVVQSRSERTHAFMAFMVAISDQILVSQASILIAALIIHDEITIYSSNIVIALGCLASTVHLGSFPFYIDRIKDHSTAKLIRVLAMVAGSGMLVFLLIIQLSYTWDMETHVYFICALRDYRMSEEMGGADVINLLMRMFVPLAVLYGTYEIIQLLYRDQPVEDNPNEPGSRDEPPDGRQNRSHLDDQGLPENGDIELQNLARLEEQGNLENHRDPSDIEVESQAIVSIMQLISVSSMDMTTDNETDYQHRRSILLKPRGAKIQFRKLLNEIKESKREQLLNRWLKLKALTILTSRIVSTRKLRLLVRLTAETWAFHQCRGSFAWRLFWLWSGNVYGIVTIFTSRAVTTGMSGNPNKMGFGQVVPLTLLALPIFAAMEGHAGNSHLSLYSWGYSLTLKADYKQKLKSIEKAHADQAILETRVTGNTRSQSGGQSPAQRQDMPAERDIASIQTVQEILKKRSEDIGYPELYTWVTGGDLTSTLSLQMGVAIHAAVMFAIATLLGFSMAYGVANINITLIVLLFLLAARRLIGLWLVVQDLRSCPMILDHLGCSNHLCQEQLGSHGERVAIGQATGDAGEDVEEEERQEA